MHKHLVLKMKKWNNFMLIFKEQWLIVISNIRSLQEILLPKNGTKIKEDVFKSMEAFGIGERNERGDRFIEFAEEHKLIIANALFQKPKIYILDLGVTRWGNKKPNTFYIE